MIFENHINVNIIIIFSIITGLEILEKQKKWSMASGFETDSSGRKSSASTAGRLIALLLWLFVFFVPGRRLIEFVHNIEITVFTSF